MNIHPDFEELLRLLEEHGVDYMIVGGYAVAYHGYPRFTRDIDLFFDCSAENIDRLRDALIAFGFRGDDLPCEAFATKGNVGAGEKVPHCLLTGPGLGRNGPSRSRLPSATLLDGP